MQQGETIKRGYYKDAFRKYKCCVLIPTYNNSQTLRLVIDSVSEYTDDIIIVNDGSTDGTIHILKDYTHLHLVDHPENKGKGIALRTGFKYASERGYDYVITIDSDGQHLAEDLPKFIEKLAEDSKAIIIGARNMETTENVPKKSSIGNKISTFWFTFETGIKISDTQSGFRLYPLYLLKDIKFFTWKYEFEIEVLVRGAWKDINVISIPISVYYAPGEKRISHFRPFKDFTRVFMLNVVLVLIAVLYIKPLQLFKKIKKKGIRKFIDQEIINPQESNFKKALSVSLGVFMGIVPVWGGQMAIALLLAFLLKLNKAIVLISSNISFGPMTPVIIYLSFITGGFVLNRPIHVDFHKDFSLKTIGEDFFQYIIGSICLATLLALIAGLMTLLLLTLFRKKTRLILTQNT